MTTKGHRAETITPGVLSGRTGVLIIDCTCGTEFEAEVGPGEGERDAIDRALQDHLAAWHTELAATS